MATCKEQIIFYLEQNPNKEISIYDFIKILKPDKTKSIHRDEFSYNTIYTILNILRLEGKVEFIDSFSRKRMRKLIKLK